MLCIDETAADPHVPVMDSKCVSAQTGGLSGFMLGPGKDAFVMDVISGRLVAGDLQPDCRFEFNWRV